MGKYHIIYIVHGILTINIGVFFIHCSIPCSAGTDSSKIDMDIHIDHAKGTPKKIQANQLHLRRMGCKIQTVQFLEIFCQKITMRAHQVSLQIKLHFQAVPHHTTESRIRGECPEES